MINVCILMVNNPSGQKQAPNPSNLFRGNVETLYGSRKGQQTARNAYGCVGLRYRKKRMQCCNGIDTGLNVPRHESEPTSGWSFVAREF